MLIRLLGKDAEANGGSWKHPFTDVPGWANEEVGYAYEKGLTKGSSATEFGTGTASAQMYLTFVLRALGYSDAAGGQFTWDKPEIWRAASASCRRAFILIAFSAPTWSSSPKPLSRPSSRTAI